MEVPTTDTGILLREPLVAADAESLHAVSDLLHDEFFELDDITFCEEQGIVTIPYRRIFHGGPSRLVRFWLLLSTYEVDVIRSVLTIRHVKDLTIDDKSDIGTYSFNTVLYADDTLRIEFNEGLDLRMTVSKLEVENRDLEIRGRARISAGFFCEWHSITEEE